MTTFGYARVSTTGQTLEVQLDQLKAAGATKIFAEKISGKAEKLNARKELDKLLKALQPGDVVVVTKLDRLARSMRDLLNIVHAIGEAKATFKSLGDAGIDTTTAHGKLILSVLGSLAEFERSLILTRTAEGRQRAIKNGVKMGPKPKLNAYQAKEALARVKAGEAMVDVAKTYGVSHSTVSRLAAREAAAG